MTKQEIASYLVSLSSLMKDQDASGVHLRSAVLADEYNKHWDLLKETIAKEKENETRQSKLERTGRSETGADREGGQRSGSGPNRDHDRDGSKR